MSANQFMVERSIDDLVAESKVTPPPSPTFSLRSIKQVFEKTGPSRPSTPTASDLKVDDVFDRELNSVIQPHSTTSSPRPSSPSRSAFSLRGLKHALRRKPVAPCESPVLDETTTKAEAPLPRQRLYERYVSLLPPPDEEDIFSYLHNNRDCHFASGSSCLSWTPTSVDCHYQEDALFLQALLESSHLRHFRRLQEITLWGDIFRRRPEFDLNYYIQLLTTMVTKRIHLKKATVDQDPVVAELLAKFYPGLRNLTLIIRDRSSITHFTTAICRFEKLRKLTIKLDIAGSDAGFIQCSQTLDMPKIRDLRIEGWNDELTMWFAERCSSLNRLAIRDTGTYAPRRNSQVLIEKLLVKNMKTLRFIEAGLSYSVDFDLSMLEKIEELHYDVPMQMRDAVDAKDVIRDVTNLREESSIETRELYVFKDDIHRRMSL